MEFIIGYYIFTLQQYFLHKIQHTSHFKTHRLQHHRTYQRDDITITLKSNSLTENLDLYFYGNILCLSINYFIFSSYVLLMQLFVGYLSYYLHNEYHNPDSIWKDWRFYKYLQNKHQIHHQQPHKNHFLLDPTFDIIFRTYT